MNLFISYLLTDPLYYFTTIIIVMFSICVHECAHAWTALKQGDETSMWLGHISLNPRVQMGWQSIIVMLLFGIAWGSVPYNPRNLRRPWSGALVAFAGPLSNLVLAFLFAGCAAVASRVMSAADGQNMAMEFLLRASGLNAMLFIFNMMPLPILDGWKVLSLLIPDMSRISSQHAGTISWIGLIFLWSRAGGLMWSASAFITGIFTSIWKVIL